MRREQRAVAARELDVRQKHFRLGGKANKNHGPWLRGVRQTLGITAVEMAATLKVGRETVFRMERRERGMDISMVKLDQMAHAMGCQLVYSIVPVKGTLTEMAEAQAWKKRLRREEKARKEGKGEAAAPVLREPEETKPVAARRETQEEKEERLQLVRKLRAMGAEVEKAMQMQKAQDERLGKTAAVEIIPAEEGESDEEKSYRQMLASLVKQGAGVSENLKQQVLRKIEEARRERVGGPLLETEAEGDARLREKFEALMRGREKPPREEKWSTEVTLEEMEKQVAYWEKWIEIKKRGGRMVEAAQCEGYRRGFVEAIAERKRVEGERGGSSD